MTTDNSTPQKKPHPAQLISSWGKANNTRSTEVTVFLVIYHSKSKAEEAIHHYVVALRIASSPNWHDQLFWAHYALAELFFGESRFGDAHNHIEHAKSHVINDAYNLDHAMELQANFRYGQRVFEKVKIEALHMYCRCL